MTLGPQITTLNKCSLLISGKHFPLITTNYPTPGVTPASHSSLICFLARCPKFTVAVNALFAVSGDDCGCKCNSTTHPPLLLCFSGLVAPPTPIPSLPGN